jgi:hypothetical protein
MNWCRSPEPTVVMTEDNHSVSIELSLPITAMFDTFIRPRQAIHITQLPFDDTEIRIP